MSPYHNVPLMEMILPGIKEKLDIQTNRIQNNKKPHSRMTHFSYWNVKDSSVDAIIYLFCA